jgi:hypothetical protein
MCPDGFILSMKKGGGEKVDEEDDEIRKKIILSSCQGVPYPQSYKKEVRICD